MDKWITAFSQDTGLWLVQRLVRERPAWPAWEYETVAMCLSEKEARYLVGQMNNLQDATG